MPKEVRDELGLAAGSKVMFVRLDDGSYRFLTRNQQLQDLAGILQQPGRPALAIEEINEGIAEGAAESGLRGLKE